jgi:hypothetical protein
MGNSSPVIVNVVNPFSFNWIDNIVYTFEVDSPFVSEIVPTFTGQAVGNELEITIAEGFNNVEFNGKSIELTPSAYITGSVCNPDPIIAGGPVLRVYLSCSFLTESEVEFVDFLYPEGDESFSVSVESPFADFPFKTDKLVYTVVVDGDAAPYGDNSGITVTPDAEHTTLLVTFPLVDISVFQGLRSVQYAIVATF